MAFTAPVLVNAAVFFNVHPKMVVGKGRERVNEFASRVRHHRLVARDVANCAARSSGATKGLLAGMPSDKPGA